jgi:hypothetical protein
LACFLGTAVVAYDPAWGLQSRKDSP